MAIEQSILKSVKKNLGLNDAYDEFDQDVITHINSAFFVLNQLGVGPSICFEIGDDEEEWDDFFEENKDLNGVKTWLYLKVRLAFDPPGTSYHIKAIEDQIVELTHRLLMVRQSRTWGAPVDVDNIYELVFDGGDSTSGG